MTNRNWLFTIGRLGDPIFAGLRRAFTEPVGQPAEIGIRIARTGRTAVAWPIRAAAERSIDPNSVTGISLLIGLCAAAWFSAGSRQDDVRGLLATGVWVLSRVGARQLAAVAEAESARDVFRERRFGWLYAVSATAAECAIYGGVAAGAQATGYPGTWALALAIVIARSVAMIAGAISHSLAERHPLSSPPLGIRTLLAALVMVGYGPRIALFTVLVIDVVILARTLIRTARRMSTGRRAIGPEVLLACRDDGPLARRAGWLVRGNLMPMPPAVAGLFAIGLLSVLGIRNLPGVVALTPVVVLLLAAPGSSHPHDGRFDWLVPVLLCLGQYGYLAALGAARSVSWLLIFTAVAITAVWYTSVAVSPAGRARGIGWEGRVCLVGLAGMFGIATFGYLGLTACLGAQICGTAVSDYLRQGEDRRR